MAWVVLILGLIALAIVSPGFRKVALFVAGAAIVGAVVIIEKSTNDDKVRARQEEQETAAARHRMTESEIELSDLVLTGDKLEGRLRNRSPRYTLRSIELKITLQDCMPRNCEIIGEHSETISENVPPGQARDFSRYVWWHDRIRTRGEFRWSYEIQYLDAREPNLSK